MTCTNKIYSATAGTALEIGSNVTTFEKGDRVLAHCISIANGKAFNQAFQSQSQSLVPVEVAAIIPNNTSFEFAAVVPLALSTASAGLYESGHLRLPLPSASPKDSGKTILLWGGSSSIRQQC